MSLVIKQSVLVSAMALLGALSVGCGDDGGGGKDTDGNADGGGVDQPYTNTLTLVPILATMESEFIGVPHTVEVWDPATGKPLNPPVTGTTSASDGKITLTTPKKAPYSIYIQGVGPTSNSSSTYDTVILNTPPATGDSFLRISQVGTASLAATPMFGNFELKADRAPIGGAVYWMKDGKRLGAVGCAKVYIDDEPQPSTQYDQRYNGANGLPVTGLTETLRQGRFYVGNITPGEHTIKASLDNGATFVGETKFVITMVRKDAKSELKNILYQIGVDIEGDANPTPASCPQ